MKLVPCPFTDLKMFWAWGAFKYYVIMFFTFLGPPTSLRIYSAVDHKKLPFSDTTHPPL